VSEVFAADRDDRCDRLLQRPHVASRL